jgi:hypothetical protein
MSTVVKALLNAVNTAKIEHRKIDAVGISRITFCTSAGVRISCEWFSDGTVYCLRIDYKDYSGSRFDAQLVIDEARKRASKLIEEDTDEILKKLGY